MDLDDPASSTNDAAGWKLHKLASLGARKFFYPPDVVLGRHLPRGADRLRRSRKAPRDDIERPLLHDQGRQAGPGRDRTDADCPGDLVANTADSTAAKGWYYSLNVNGEKTVNAPLTIGGIVYFGTNRPVTEGRLQGRPRRGAVLRDELPRRVRHTDAGRRRTGDDAYSKVLTGGGLPPSPSPVWWISVERSSRLRRLR